MSKAQATFWLEARDGQNPATPICFCGCSEAIYWITHAILSTSKPPSVRFDVSTRVWTTFPYLAKTNLCFTFS